MQSTAEGAEGARRRARGAGVEEGNGTVAFEQLTTRTTSQYTSLATNGASCRRDISRNPSAP